MTLGHGRNIASVSWGDHLTFGEADGLLDTPDKLRRRLEVWRDELGTGTLHWRHGRGQKATSDIPCRRIWPTEASLPCTTLRSQTALRTQHAAAGKSKHSLDPALRGGSDQGHSKTFGSKCSWWRRGRA